MFATVAHFSYAAVLSNGYRINEDEVFFIKLAYQEVEVGEVSCWVFGCRDGSHGPRVVRTSPVLFHETAHGVLAAQLINTSHQDIFSRKKI